MNSFKTYAGFLLLSTALLLVYCSSPTKSKKKVTQAVQIDNVSYSNEEDNNENGYYSSLRLHFDIRVTTGDITAHIAMGVYRESDNALLGADVIEAVYLTDSWESYYFDINEDIGYFPQDTYWIGLLVVDAQDQEKVYLTYTGETNSELANLYLEQLSEDTGFYMRFNNYCFTQIDLTVEGSAYSLPVGGSIKIDFSGGNPGSVGWEGMTYGKTGDTQQQIGRILYWDYREDNTVGRDSLVWDLTIHSDWFFLFMLNNSGYNWSPIDINVGIPDDYFREYIRILTGGGWTTTGYYKKNYPTEVDAYYEDYPSSSPIVWSSVEFAPAWPDKYSNSSYIATLSYPSTAKINTDDILLKAIPIGGTRELVRDLGSIAKRNASHGTAVPNTGAR
jgi:hypothetical protein